MQALRWVLNSGRIGGYVVIDGYEVRLEEARKLLMRWQSFARTLDEAGLVALPVDLDSKTTGLLDATAC